MNLKKKIKTNKSILIVIVLLLICRIIYLKTLTIPMIQPDTYTYLEYDFVHLFKNGRTFVYPTFLRIARCLFSNDTYLKGVCFLQDLISIISVIYIYKIFRFLTKKELFAAFLAFYYGNSIVIVGWNYCILTESLALSFTVFYFYYFIIFIKNKNNKDGIICIFLLFIMIFLRPSFLLFYALLLLIIIRTEMLSFNFKTLKTIIASVVLGFVILIYSSAFYHNFGIFTISDPMPRQILNVVISRDYYKNSLDNEWVNNIDYYREKYDNELWLTTLAVMSHYENNLALIQKKSIHSIFDNMKKYIYDEIKLGYSLLEDKYNSYFIISNKINKSDFLYSAMFAFYKIGTLIPIKISLYVALVYAFIFLVKLSRGYVDLLALFFVLHIPLVFLSTIIVTCTEYLRTMIHLYPLTLIGLSAFNSYFTINIKDVFTEFDTKCTR